MSFPDIHPINLGKDGWALLYPDATSRLLFLCGLRPCSHGWMVRNCVLSPAVAKVVTESAKAAESAGLPYYVGARPMKRAVTPRKDQS